MRIHTDRSAWAILQARLILLLCVGGLWLGTASAQQRQPTDAAQMTPTGQVGGIPFAVETQGSYAFVGVGPRVEILDATQAGTVVVGRSTILPGVVRSLTAAGNLLYVSLGKQGVLILDISDPAAPTTAGSFTTYGQVTDVAVDGNYAYVTSVFDSFRIFDIVNPAAVTQVAEYASIRIAYAVDVVDGYAYVAANNDGLVTVDVRVPASPQSGGQLATTSNARNVLVSGTTAFVADQYGNPTVMTVNVADPSAPVKLGGYQTPGETYGLALVGNTLYVTTWDNGLYLLDVSNPASPTLQGRVNTPGRAVDVAVANGFAYVADDWGGWRKVNVTDPTNPVIVTEAITPGEVRQVAVDGNRAVILDNSLGAFIVDVTDPAQMSIQGRTAGIDGAIGNAEDVALFGSHAYAIQSGHVRVFDIANPAAPVVGIQVETPGQAQSLALRDNRLFVADGAGGLHIYGLENPASPALLGTYATAPDEAKIVLVDGKHAYVAANGLHVVDISQPATPTRLGYYKPAGSIFGMDLAGHLLYLSGGFKGVWTINVSNPATPTEIGHYEKMMGYSIAATEQGIFVLDNQFDQTLLWLDMDDPAHPTILATFPTQVQDMVIADSILYVAGDWSGLLTFPVPKQVSVSEVRPNQGRAAWANQVHVYGSNFQSGATARLVSSGNLYTTLEIDTLIASHLGAIVPAGLPGGVYGIRVTNPDGGRATLNSAYTVIPPTADILSAYADELWIGPHAARQNDATGVGLVVHRAGGSADRKDVTVDFYVGNPNAGGLPLGNAAIASLSPNSYTSTLAIPWTPATESSTDIYAVINPGSIAISRTVDVLPPVLDTQPPVVNSFETIPSGPNVADLNLSLTLGASDNLGGSGVGSVYVMEFDWNANVGMWVKVGDSGWLDYTGDPMMLPWSLRWSPGVKNMVAWAADRAGNISVSGKTIWLNFMPAALSVNQGMWQMFSYWLDGGQSLTATSTPVLGDPDLYLGSSSGWLDWSTQTGTVPDTVSIVAPGQALYSVGVYGWTTARYGLSISGALAQRQASAPDRDPVGLPCLPPGAVPPQALPTAPIGYDVYLPSAMK